MEVLPNLKLKGLPLVKNKNSKIKFFRVATKPKNKGIT